MLSTDSSTNYALSPNVLNEAISNDIADGLVPFFLCATVRYKETSDPKHVPILFLKCSLTG